ncbi:MAG: RNA polymerase sigma factor RpoS, partial [Betaproteobacteria bacterium]|nr:RNA polymerase sigma factor RpoS [Betaproteobacteria bacterium]
DITQMYLNEIGHQRLLTPKEEHALACRAKEGDQQARQAMIEHNLRFVVSVAKKYVNRGLDLLDLIEEGNLGLMHALDKFDPQRGFRFTTYASWWVRQSIERAIMNCGRTIRLPVHVIKELNLSLRAQRHLEREAHDGRDPTAEDVAQLLGKPAEEVRRILWLSQSITSLDALVNPDSSVTIADAVLDEDHVPVEEAIQSTEVSAHIARWLDGLSERQRWIIERRFGLNGHSPCTLEQLAKRVKLTRERVRQLQEEALTALRAQLGTEDVDGFMA